MANNNNKVKVNLPDMTWLNADNLTDKIKACNTWLEWYDDEVKKLDCLGKKDYGLYVKYINQAGALKVILEMLQAIKQHSKTLIGE